MAKSPGKKDEKKEKPPQKGGLLAWVVAPVLGIVALPTLVLLLVGMAPTLVAFFIMDRHPSKYTTRAVGYLNFSGCLPYAIDLWRAGGVWDFEGLLMIVSNPFTLLVMYSMAAVGWLILFASPPVVAAYLAVTSDMREKTLKARQKELIEIWGRNVRLGSMGAELEDDDDDEPVNSEEKPAAAAAPSS
jgi:hypothetical protein